MWEGYFPSAGVPFATGAEGGNLEPEPGILFSSHAKSKLPEGAGQGLQVTLVADAMCWSARQDSHSHPCDGMGWGACSLCRELQLQGFVLRREAGTLLSPEKSPLKDQRMKSGKVLFWAHRLRSE